MLQKIREKGEGLIVWAIVLMIAMTFAFFGLSDYFSAGMNNSVAAEVNGQKISWRQVEHYAERLSQQHRGEMDRSELFKQSIANTIRRVALIENAHGLGLRVGDEQVVKLLSQIPVFQVEGKFSKKHYLDLLKQASYTDAEFRRELSQDILLGQIERGLNGSNYLSQEELQEVVGVLDQKRSFGYVIIPQVKFHKNIKVTTEQIQEYYTKNKSKFVTPEHVVLEYVQLSFEPLLDQVHPTKEEVKKYYEDHQSAYVTPERIHARHILITVPEGDHAIDQKASEKIRSISKQLKEGADFETLAKKESQDPGSADSGGDLGWFGKGQMVPEFDKLAFSLKKPGEISEPIKTPFGYHLIQLVERKATEVRPFEQVKSLVEEQIKREKAQLTFAEKAEKIAKMAFEQGTTLTELAKQFGLEIKETDPITREHGTGIADSKEVLKVAFDADVLKGRNSEPVRLKDNSMAIFHLKALQAAVQRTQEEADKDIQALIAIEKAKEAAKEMGDKIVQDLRDGASPVELLKKAKEEKESLKWVAKSNVIRAARDVPHEIVSFAYQMAPAKEGSKEPSVRGFELSTGDYLVLALDKVVPGDWAKIDEEAQNSYREALTKYSNQVEYMLYVEQVLKSSKIRMSKPPNI